MGVLLLDVPSSVSAHKSAVGAQALFSRDTACPLAAQTGQVVEPFSPIFSSVKRTPFLSHHFFRADRSLGRDEEEWMNHPCFLNGWIWLDLEHVFLCRLSLQKKDVRMLRFIQEVNTTTRSCSLWDLEEDTEYIVHVQSISIQGQSPASEPVLFKTPREAEKLASKNKGKQGWHFENWHKMAGKACTAGERKKGNYRDLILKWGHCSSCPLPQPHSRIDQALTVTLHGMGQGCGSLHFLDTVLGGQKNIINLHEYIRDGTK